MLSASAVCVVFVAGTGVRVYFAEQGQKRSLAKVGRRLASTIDPEMLSQAIYCLAGLLSRVFR